MASLPWFKIALTLVQGLTALVIFLREKKLIDAGKAEAIAEAMQVQAGRVRLANEARARVRTTISGGGVFEDPYDTDRH
jgi:predicted nucleic acid-binding protein